jgi:ABC-type Fe3+/spermidine/putrescine transport system ATPase subunit
MMMGKGLEVRTVSKRFGETIALDSISFSVQPNEVVAILGPSGCGKSTALMVIAGLVPVDSGEIFWNGENLAGIPAHKRHFGLMFQDYALFPHMDVADNVAFGLRMLGQTSEDVARTTSEMLQLVGLKGYEERDVNTLSGGEQQRVALARALAPQPRLLMLDEPLSSVDRTMREHLLVDLRQALKATGQTALYVTHDQEEAFALADRVAIMQAGAVDQFDTPEQIYCCPSSPFVASFIGLDNLIPAQITGSGPDRRIESALGHLPAPDGYENGPVTLLLRPDGAQIGGSREVSIKGKVVSRSFRGNMRQMRVEVSAVQLRFEFLAIQELPEIGQHVRLSFDPDQALQVFA